MSVVWKDFLWMSFSGSLLIMVLLAGKGFWKNRVSRQWQYYIWLVVIARLLLPFGLQAGPGGRLVEAVQRVGVQNLSLSRQYHEPESEEAFDGLTVALGQEEKGEAVPEEGMAVRQPVREILALFADHSWLIWLVGALLVLIRRVTIYQSFLRYVNARAVPVSDAALLDRLSLIAEQAGIRRPVELCVNPLVSSPLLTGFFHPCIVLPWGDISEEDFRHIALHELIHYKRLDLFYKWLVQIVVCLHWFNPLVHLMSREIAKACEFSCDEAVIVRMSEDGPRDYGKTLLDAMAAVGSNKEFPGAVTFGENKRLLKERLEAIMSFKKKSKAGKALTGILTAGICIGAAFLWGDTSLEATATSLAAAAPERTEAEEPAVTEKEQKGISSLKETLSRSAAASAKRYYEADNLALFQIAFSRLDEEAQEEWLEKIYEDDDSAFFSAGISMLCPDNPLIGRFAEKAYADHNSAFFSISCSRMERETLKEWLDRATSDQKAGFQTILLEKLGLDEELAESRAEWERRQLEEYRRWGITREDGVYSYQGEPVNIFLDLRLSSIAYTMEVNPEGTVNIRVVRDERDEITGVTYLTEAEVAELFGDTGD